MKPRILNTDDNSELDAMKSTHDYAAGSEADLTPGNAEEESNETPGKTSTNYPEDKPFPDELANPEEQNEEDELPDNG